MRHLKLSVLPLAVAMVAALIVSVGFASSAEAATKLRIRTTTKTVATGDTARVKGTVFGAKGGVAVVIQQRRGGSGKDWGSGRTVTTNSAGKFELSRKIKGKYTRDYRACIGPKNRRSCSLRARIQVVPRGPGITVTAAPSEVGAAERITLSGVTDPALAGAPVGLEEQNPTSLAWKAVAYAIVKPDFTFSVSGDAPIFGKGRVFRVTSAATSSRPQSVSNLVAANVYGRYFLTGLNSDMGGLKRGAAYYPGTNPNAAVVGYGASVSPSSGTGPANGLARIPVNGSCRRLVADVFLDQSAAVDAAMNTQVLTTIETTQAVAFENGANNPIKRNDALVQVAADITNAQFVTLQSSLDDQAGATPADVWYGNAFVTCAF